MTISRIAPACSVALVIGVLGSLPTARADAVPPIPDPRCEPGFVVGHFHGGPACVRPSCDRDADCPRDLRCSPRRCAVWREIPGCRSATPKEPPMPPDPCRELVELGACTSATACGADAWCPTGQCLPPEEIAALSVPAPALAEFGLLTSDPETHEPEASEPEVAVEGESAETEPSDTSETTETSAATAPATTTPRSGGGCCGSRGARTRATALGLLALVPLTLLRKTRGQHEFERRRRAGSEAAKRSI